MIGAMVGKRVTLVAAALLALTTSAGSAPGTLAPRQARIFQQTCAHCHAHPGIGVPVVGDTAAWEERRARGFEALLAHTVNGFGNMPPLGTCSFCSEQDLRILVAFTAGMEAPAP